MGHLTGDSLDRFWHWGSHAESLMRPHVIVLAEPVIDNDLCLPGRCEPLGVEHLVAQRAIEALVISALPGRSGIDLDVLDANCDCAMLPNFLRHAQYVASLMPAARQADETSEPLASFNLISRNNFKQSSSE